MIYAHLNNQDAYGILLSSPVWKEAFEHLRSLPARPAFGITPLRGEDMYMNVMEYQTLGRGDCRFETHRKYVDLQYTLTGGEIIEWRRSADLEVDGAYDEAKDLQFYHLGASSARIHMLPGYFSIFYPSDAHLPKISDGVHPFVYKVVIKVGLSLLNDQ